MLCTAVLYYAVLCCTVLCCAVVWSALLWCAALYRGLRTWCVALFYTVLAMHWCDALSCTFMDMQLCDAPFCAITAMRWCDVLFCAVLCSEMADIAVLCWVGMCSAAERLYRLPSKTRVGIGKRADAEDLNGYQAWKIKQKWYSKRQYTHVSLLGHQWLLRPIQLD